MTGISGALAIITLLGIQLNLTETPNIDCQTINEAEGCYVFSENRIYVDVNSEDMEDTIYHELAHALFYGNRHIEEMVEKNGSSDDETIDPAEKVAESYAFYMSCPEGMKEKYPELHQEFQVFNTLLEKYIKSSNIEIQIGT